MCSKLNLQKFLNYSSSLRPGFEGCSEIMNDPLYLRFVCLEQNEIFPEYKTLCFFCLTYNFDHVTHHVTKNLKSRKSEIRRRIFFIEITELVFPKHI